MTDRLERQTGIEHLNFGAAGNFSSVREWLLYASLGSRFDHDRVLLFTLPNNDFLENDPDRWWQPERYRPYLRGTPGQFELFYPVDFEDSRAATEERLRWSHCYNASLVLRFWDWADTQIRVRWAEGPTTPFGYVGCVSSGEIDLARLFLLQLPEDP